MTVLSFVQDASNPQGVALQPGVIVAAGYIGGDTPHVWTAADWAVWGCRWRVPIWVRSNPGDVDATVDANACVAALVTQGAPPPYLVSPYGSESTITGNPAADGYWVALWDGKPDLTGMPGGTIAKQYTSANSFDLSVIDQSVSTWDTQTGTGPTLVMLDLETAVSAAYVSTFAAVLHAVPPSGDVIVPSVVGLQANSARDQLEALGLTARISTSHVVVSQTPGPGTVVPAGSNVNLGA